ncbi:MAG TPA: hypothetical protein VGQ99_00545 [Tepidisphaeraceae bacterium]|jgi:hypothetical protein|nr:hypothetical protein [Tepidisphaeraceae bacterium]
MTTGTTGILPVTRPGRPWYIFGSSFLLSLAFSLYFAFTIGRNLGLFFGGLVLASILAPMLTVAEEGLPNRASILAGIITAIALVWLTCIFNDTITLWEWSRATLVLLFYTLAISALAALLAKVRIPPAAVVILSLAWLSWPVWLAPALHGQSSQRTVAALVVGNPTFAIQGALSRSFPVPWPQHRIAYRLTNIGDDIPYQMPTSILPSILGHGLPAAIALLAAHWPARPRARPAHPPVDQSPRST